MFYRDNTHRREQKNLSLSFSLPLSFSLLSFFLFLFLSISLPPLFFNLSLLNKGMPDFLRSEWSNFHDNLPSIPRYLFSAFSFLLSLSLSFLFLRFSSVDMRKSFVRTTTVCKSGPLLSPCPFLTSHITQREISLRSNGTFPFLRAWGLGNRLLPISLPSGSFLSGMMENINHHPLNSPKNRDFTWENR